MNPKTQRWLESFPEGRTYHLQSNQSVISKPKQDMTLEPIKMQAVAALPNGAQILAIEGTLVKLFPPNSGTGQYGEWKIQNGSISDGQLKHDIAFMDDGTIPPDGSEGARVRITAQEYKGKLKGITLTDKLVKGKQKRTIEVKFPAKVEILGGASQPAPRPAQSQPVPAGTTTPHSVNGGGYQQDMEPAPTNEPMEDRIDDLIKTVNLVCLAIGRDPDEMWNAASADKIIELGVGCICSFKGKYGTHSRPTFRDSSAAQATMENQQALMERSQAVTQELSQDEAPVSAPSWRDFTYENKAGLQRLGDKSEADIAKLHTFCQSNPMNTQVLQDLAANVAAAVKELEEAKGGYREGMEKDDIPF